MNNSASFEDLVRDAVGGVIEDVVTRALAEQRELLAPLQSRGDLLRRRVSLSIAETAEVLGVGKTTVRNWLDAGELVALDFSGGRRIIGTDQILTKLAAANGRRRNCGETPQ